MDFAAENIPYKPLVSSSIGGMLEVYDLYIFGLLAPTIAPLFFPINDSIWTILAGYLTFAVAFFFRPLGSIFFGHIGDRYGRRVSLYSCLLLMSVATLAIGLLPTYEEVGTLAPLLLIIARILQGVSAGGEFSGGLVFVAEHSGSRKIGITIGLGLAGNITGVLLGSFVALIVTLPNMPVWGWRIPFIIGFSIALAGLYIRRFLPETPLFLAAREKGEIEKIPFLSGIRVFYKQIFFSIIIMITSGIIYYLNVISLPPLFIKLFSVSETLSKLGNTIGLLFMVVMIPVFGFLTDKFNKVLLVKIAIIIPTISTLFALYILYADIFHSTSNLLIYQIISGIFLAMNMITIDVFLIKSFAIKIRYSCFGFSHDLGIAIAGLTPFIVALLVHNNNYAILSISIVILCLLSVWAVSWLQKSLDKT